MHTLFKFLLKYERKFINWMIENKKLTVVIFLTVIFCFQIYNLYQINEIEQSLIKIENRLNNNYGLNTSAGD